MSSGQAKLPTAIFVIAAVVGLIVLIALQLFGRNGPTQNVSSKEVFTPPPSARVDIPRPRAVAPPTAVVETVKESKGYKEFNMLEIERMRQITLLKEQKRKLLQAQKAAEEAEQDRRMKSSIILVDRGGTAPTADDSGIYEPAFADNAAGLFGGESDPNDNNEINADGNERYLRDVSNLEVVKAQAVKLANQDYLLTQGTFITGITETMVNSDLPGMVRAIVDKAVYGRTGKIVVVPKGSRLIGRYRSGVAVGQSRVYIVWTRLERPDGVVINLGSPGADRIGQAGMKGDVDTHFFERFGASTLFSALGPALSAVLEKDGQSANTREIIDGGRQGFERSSEIILRQSIGISPTIRVPQGSEITIFVNRDLSFHGVQVQEN